MESSESLRTLAGLGYVGGALPGREEKPPNVSKARWSLLSPQDIGGAGLYGRGAAWKRRKASQQCEGSMESSESLGHRRGWAMWEGRCLEEKKSLPTCGASESFEVPENCKGRPGPQKKLYNRKGRPGPPKNCIIARVVLAPKKIV